MKMVR